MKTKIVLSAFLILSIIILGGCDDNEKKIMVHKNFVHPDSLEIKIELFLAVSCDKELRENNFLEYLDKASIEYELTNNSSGYIWYDVYANHKKYHIGFARGRMFSYWVR